MAQPQDLLYSKEHEWVKLEGETAIVGITEYAQESLGDIVYVELPKVGTRVEQFGAAGVVESVKAVSDLFSPIGGEVIEVNTALENDPAAINRDPYGAGWMFKVAVADRSQAANLLDAAAYERLVAEAAS